MLYRYFPFFFHRFIMIKREPVCIVYIYFSYKDSSEGKSFPYVFSQGGERLWYAHSISPVHLLVDYTNAPINVCNPRYYFDSERGIGAAGCRIYTITI